MNPYWKAFGLLFGAASLGAALDGFRGVHVLVLLVLMGYLSAWIERRYPD